MGKSKGKKVSTKPPSGMRDFLPADIARRQHVISIVREVFGRYGFVPIETPAIENLSTLLGKYGEEGDQLLYRLLHRRDALTRALAADEVSEATLADKGLRYDLTVPLARVAAQYGALPKFFKRYQIQPVWRADRPGKGRFREFYQCDVDITGTSSLVAEAEVCGAAAEVLEKLGFEDFELRINHRELLRAMIRAAEVDEALEGSALIAVDKLDKIGLEGVKQELEERGLSPESAAKLLGFVCCEQLLEPGSPLYNVVDPQQSLTWGILGVAALSENEDQPQHVVVLEFLKRLLHGDEKAAEVLDELALLFELLGSTPAGPRIRLFPALARGLSYYTGAIFEVAVPDLGSSLAGGGRYDNLIGMFGKHEVPAVGMALGLERILVVMEQRGMFPELSEGPEVLLCWLDVGAPGVLKTAHALRQQGLRVEVYPESAKLKKQLGYADSEGVKAPVAAILGADEAAAEAITLKHLASGEQKRGVPIAEASATIRRWLEPAQ